MGTVLRVGRSQRKDAREAAQEAASAALEGADAPVVALVFATWQYDVDALAAGLASRLDGLPWAGCTTVAAFAEDALIEHGVVVGVIDSPGARAGVGVGEAVGEGERAAGAAAVAAALSDMPLTPADRSRLLLVFPDTTRGNAAEVVRGAVAEGGAGVVWAGGGSGDNLGRSRAVQLAEGRVRRDCVVVVAVDLPSRVGAGVQHGWQPYGPSAMVTRASGVVAEELEYRSAFDVYRDAAVARGMTVDEASFTSFAMMHPLGIPQAGQEYLIRDPVSIEPGGGLRCVGEVPDGALVRFMRAEHDAVVEAAGRAAALAREGLRGGITGALVFDCVSRYLILGDAFGDELAAYRGSLGPAVPMIGCLTYGEVGAFGDRVPQFHNKTSVVVAIPA